MSAIAERINRVATSTGSTGRAFAGFRSQPLPSFGDKTAEGLAKEGRAGAVKDDLSRIAPNPAKPEPIDRALAARLLRRSLVKHTWRRAGDSTRCAWRGRLKPAYRHGARTGCAGFSRPPRLQKL